MTDQAIDSPILVSGMPRSGTTWMQTFLSLHPDIHIHGQPPQDFSWENAHNWYLLMCRNAGWAEQSNRDLNYEIPHYAGTTQEQCAVVFRRMYRDFMCGLGPRKRQWGLKFLGICADPISVTQFESLWPETRWVIGLRHPLASLNSIRNTFAPSYPATKWLGEWLDCLEFIQRRAGDRVVSFDVDRLQQSSEQERVDTLSRLTDCVGIELSPSMRELVTNWTRVHEVKPASEKRKLVTRTEFEHACLNLPDLPILMRRHGYEIDPYLTE